MSLLIKKKKLVKYQGSYCTLNSSNRKDLRIAVLMFFFILFGAIILFRTAKLQIFDHSYYIALASGQHEIFKQLQPERGTVYIKNKQGVLVGNGNENYPMAMNKNMNLLYAVPKDIKDPEAVLEGLKEVFQLKERQQEEAAAPDVETQNFAPDEESTQKEEFADDQDLIDSWQEKLNKPDDPYEPLKHLVTDEQIEQIAAFNFEGLSWTKEIARYYPEKETASQLIGFVGKQSESAVLKGYYGIESCFDKELAGDPGFLRSELDTAGRWIAITGKDFKSAQDGNDFYLTIDKSIQYYACNELNKGVEQYDAEGGSLIIMDPKTGAIIAMCNSPSFDPNKYNEIEDLSILNNNAISENYEPGSVFKPFTMAAALDTGKVDPFTGYQDNGEVRVNDYTIRNSDLKANGWQTMTQVLEKSLNTGVVFAARKTGIDEFKRYVESFGFGQATGIDLCRECEGNFSSFEKKAEIYMATASFGQGITVTPMQLVRAFGAIANDGKMMEPYVVEKMVNKEGEVVQQTQPKITNQVISPQTAKMLGGMLVSVVKSGHAKKAAVPGYLVAGKTGTAQVPDFEKGGYSDKTMHTFIGFAPFNNPRFVMLVKLNNPSAVEFAADSTTPIFGKVAKFILDYYEIPPEEK